jgi:hypothetical protein
MASSSSRSFCIWRANVLSLRPEFSVSETLIELAIFVLRVPVARVRVASPCCSLPVRTSKLEAARIRFADGSRRAVRDELNHDIHQRFCCALISHHVHVAGWLEEGGPGWNYSRCAGGVVSFIEARGARFDDHKTQAWMTVPAEPAARLNRDLYDVEVRHPLGHEPCSPLVDLGEGLDVSELAQIGQ